MRPLEVIIKVSTLAIPATAVVASYFLAAAKVGTSTDAGLAIPFIMPAFVLPITVGGFLLRSTLRRDSLAYPTGRGVRLAAVVAVGAMVVILFALL